MNDIFNRKVMYQFKPGSVGGPFGGSTNNFVSRYAETDEKFAGTWEINPEDRFRILSIKYGVVELEYLIAETCKVGLRISVEGFVELFQEVKPVVDLGKVERGDTFHPSEPDWYTSYFTVLAVTYPRNAPGKKVFVFEDFEGDVLTLEADTLAKRLSDGVWKVGKPSE